MVIELGGMSSSLRRVFYFRAEFGLYPSSEPLAQLKLLPFRRHFLLNLEGTAWRSLVSMISLAETLPRLSKVGAHGTHG